MTLKEQQYQEGYENPFLNIPPRKLESAIEKISKVHSKNGLLTTGGGRLVQAVQRYYEANIPVDYWFRDMTGFSGDKSLIRAYNSITEDIDYSYDIGRSICFGGPHGVGKSLTCACILKRVVERGKHTALYVNLTDIVSLMTSPMGDDKFVGRKLLLNVDFLVIDEFDQRFMGTDNAADLFGRILEPTMRARIQNNLSLFFCTNSPNIISGFTGPIQASLSSLMNRMTKVTGLGGDFRAKEGAK